MRETLTRLSTPIYFEVRNPDGHRVLPAEPQALLNNVKSLEYETYLIPFACPSFFHTRHTFTNNKLSNGLSALQLKSHHLSL